MSTDKAVYCPCNTLCPLQSALKKIGGKWKFPIICVIHGADGVRYNEIMRKTKGITNTMLASSLKELEKDGLVKRVQYNEMPLRVEYFATEKAMKLVPIAGQLIEWELANITNKN